MSDQDPLMLTCWNCDNEFQANTLGRPLDDQNAVELCPRCGAGFKTPPLPRREFKDVARKPADYPEYQLDEDEVRRRLPGIRKIVDRDIQAEVVRLSSTAPAYFWWLPAASPLSDYHHPACRETHGLWAHTLMGVQAAERLTETKVAQDIITIEERDYVLAASILHDQRKRGEHGSDESSSTHDHAVHMAEVIEDESDLPQPVADAVASHMGPEKFDYAGPEPETEVQHLVHEADMVASTTLVPDALPEELEDNGLGVSNS